MHIKSIPVSLLVGTIFCLTGCFLAEKPGAESIEQALSDFCTAAREQDAKKLKDTLWLQESPLELQNLEVDVTLLAFSKFEVRAIHDGPIDQAPKAIHDGRKLVFSGGPPVKVFIIKLVEKHVVGARPPGTAELMVPIVMKDERFWVSGLSYSNK
jgi:hypothetical protein